MPWSEVFTLAAEGRWSGHSWHFGMRQAVFFASCKHLTRLSDGVPARALLADLPSLLAYYVRYGT